MRERIALFAVLPCSYKSCHKFSSSIFGWTIGWSTATKCDFW